MGTLPETLLDRIQHAVDPIAGVLGGVRTVLAPSETNPWYIETSTVGRPNQFAPDVILDGDEAEVMSGAGGARDQRQARGFAIIEGLERYACCVYDPRVVETLTWRRARLRGAFAIDELPSLSAKELSHPKCPIGRPDLDAAIRWIPAENYLTGEASMLPLTMTHLHVRNRSAAENFWLPISTGVAAHGTADAAVCSGLVENIERDSISLTWIHKLGLSPILTDDHQEIAELIAMARLEGRDIMLFDASLDHTVPIVYAVDRSDSSIMRTVVSCAADYSYESAALKALREATSCRVALEYSAHEAQRSARAVDDFIDVFDGALFMGRPENVSAFDFLTANGKPGVRVDWHASIGEPGRELALELAEHVRRQTGSSTYATSLTTTECRAFGLEVWRAVSPGLQPLSFAHRAQWRGTPRLQTGPRAAGFNALMEEAQNAHPQPFA